MALPVSQMLLISVTTIWVVWVLYYWMDRWSGVRNEGFANPGPPLLSQADLAKLNAVNKPTPTAEDAEQAYKTLLYFIQEDYARGVKYVMDFGDRFFGAGTPIRGDLDVRKLMENYSSPLQRL